MVGNVMERTRDAEHASGKLWFKNSSPGTPSNTSARRREHWMEMELNTLR